VGWTRFAALLLVPAFSLPALGQGGVYQWTDERGVVHFSDSHVPPDYAERAKLRPNQVAPTLRPRNASGVRIPLESRHGKKYASVLLEGNGRQREVLMLVDTAAQISMVDEALADELRLEHLEDAGIIGVTGVSPGWIARLRRIRLKDRELRDWRVMVGPQPGTLLLGMDVLDRLELAVGADALEGP
jgi:predicted aspartyl protease